MEQTKEKKANKKRGNLYRNLVELIAVGSVTGVVAGIVVTAFTILVREGEHISQNAYAYVRENPVFLPLLLLALFCAAFLIGVAMQLSTVVRGGGVPQAEGASRGSVPLKWWRDLTLMFAAALVSIFAGLSIGSEGPSVLIGACAGDGVSKTLKRDEMIKKYQITGGACAGLAVAMNAPLMGMAFAFEEAHKRFTPEVFICAFTSVIFGMLARIGVYNALGMEVVNSFRSYLLFELPFRYYGYVLLAGVLCGGLGIVFYKLCFVLRRAFKRIKAKNERRALFLRVTLVVGIGGLVSLLAAGVMGGGHGFIEGLGTLGGSKEVEVAPVFGLGVLLSLLLILLLRFFITATNVGAGIPCGTFVPILATGACVGGLLNALLVKLGMDEKYCDLMIMICMAAYFTAIVRAPITAIVMICELTGSFAPLLPVIIAVSIGYVIGEMCKTDGIYEELLEAYEKEAGIHERAVSMIYSLTVAEGSLADGREVRNILWPAGTRVKELHRGEEVILPEGDTLLRGEDLLIIVCKTSQQENAYNEILHILE